MSMEAAASGAGVALSAFEQIRHARGILERESRAIAQVARRLDHRFCEAVELLLRCRGSVIVSGMGKAGLIGQKIAATLASTGTPSHCLHPAEAVHGDLGRLRPGDLALILSQSGETEEVVRILPLLGELGVPIVAITGRADSTLGRAAAVVLDLGPLEEACPLGLAPSTSTAAMLAVGDALALVASRMRHFGREDFARFHPAGALGWKLAKVERHMRPLSACRVAFEGISVREVLVAGALPGRRTGAIMLVDADGKLSGIFTDSDLARLVEHRREREFDAPIRSVMTAAPRRVAAGTTMGEAVVLLARHKISELPVVDAREKPLGLLDITDVVDMLPKEEAAAAGQRAAAPAPGWRVVAEPDDRSPA
jgi:arabinose-5-phosphate isomerase